MNLNSIGILFLLTISLSACVTDNNLNPNPNNVPFAEITPPVPLDTQKIHLENVLIDYSRFIEKALDTLDLPSIAYAIVKDGQVIKQYVYGVKKKGEQDSIDENTVFRMASVSKTFAGGLATILVDKGVFSWEDKVRDIETSFRLKESASSKAITIRHMMSHSTGLRKYAMSRDIQAGKKFHTIFRNLAKAPIQNKVGEIYDYQNAMYSVISKVVKRKTNLSYEQMLDSLIFKPLKMPNISVGYNPMNANKNKAYPHIKKGRDNYSWQPVNLRTAWYNVNPAAGINASLADMTIWLKAMLGHYPEVVSDKALAEMFTPQIAMNEDSDYYENWAPGIRQASYGLGWRSFDFKGKRVAYHGGWLRGYRPEIGLCPEEDIGIVFLTNSDKNDLATMCVPAFFKLYFADPKI